MLAAGLWHRGDVLSCAIKSYMLTSTNWQICVDIEYYEKSYHVDRWARSVILTHAKRHAVLIGKRQ